MAATNTPSFYFNPNTFRKVLLTQTPNRDDERDLDILPIEFFDLKITIYS